MIEYEEQSNDIARYFMEYFKYRKSLIYLTVDNAITARRNSRIDLYLRIRKAESSNSKCRKDTLPNPSFSGGSN